MFTDNYPFMEIFGGMLKEPSNGYGEGWYFCGMCIGCVFFVATINKFTNCLPQVLAKIK